MRCFNASPKRRVATTGNDTFESSSEDASIAAIRLLCYGITIWLARENTDESPGSGTITSDLRDEGNENESFHAAVDGLESLILAHACAGIDVASAAYVEGVETAVEAIANNL